MWNTMIEEERNKMKNQKVKAVKLDLGSSNNSKVKEGTEDLQMAELGFY